MDEHHRVHVVIGKPVALREEQDSSSGQPMPPPVIVLLQQPVLMPDLKNTVISPVPQCPFITIRYCVMAEPVVPWSNLNTSPEVQPNFTRLGSGSMVGSGLMVTHPAPWL
jgi:hypothetical protein